MPCPTLLSPPPGPDGTAFKHGSNLSGKIRPRRVSSQWNSTGNAKIGADMLSRALDKYTRPLPGGLDYPPDTTGVTDDEWRDTFSSGFPSDKPATKRQAFNRAKTDLIANRVVVSLNDWVWFCRRSDERSTS